MTLYAVWENKDEVTLTSSMVSLSYAKTSYTGKALTPNVTVKNGTQTLKKGTDYTVSYKGNKNIGKATVTVKGIGKYKGTVTKTFEITAPTKGKSFTVSKTKYKITDTKKNTVSVTGTSRKGAVSIPKTTKIGGKTYKVTGINANAFKNNKKITKIVIGANVNSIGKQAFYGCNNVESIVIKSNKLTSKSIGASAFKKVSSKAVVTVPKKKEKAYKKLLKKKGLSSKVKLKTK